MSLSIRLASRQDAGWINELYDHYIQNTEITFNERGKTMEARAAEIEALMRDYPFLVAQDGGKPLGFACAEAVRPQSGYRFSVELTIYLRPDAPKRAGAGRALYERLLAILTAQGFRNAYAVISGTNEASLLFHERMGFETVARFENSGYKHGRWLDAVWMRRTLNPFSERPEPPVPFEAYRAGL